MKFLEKIQSLPDKKRKQIFWFIMAIVVVILLGFLIQRSKTRFDQSEGISLEESLELPKIQGTINQIINNFFKE